MGDLNLVENVNQIRTWPKRKFQVRPSKAIIPKKHKEKHDKA